MRWKCLPLLFVLFLSSCDRKEKAAPAKPPTPPDWIELDDQRTPAEVRFTPKERRQAAFSSELKLPRLLVYDYPQVEQLTLPATGEMYDVAFYDVGGRALNVYPHAYCSASTVCQPLTSKYLATLVLIAPVGTFEKFGVKKYSQVRWGKPAWQERRRTRTYPLKDHEIKVEPLDRFSWLPWRN